MEKSRCIWNFSRSSLGLILIYLVFSCPLNSKEIFEFPLKLCTDFGYNSIRTVTFHCISLEPIDIDNIVKSIIGEKSKVIITGDKGVDFKPLSADLFVDIFVVKNPHEKSYLVTINANVKGEAKVALNKSGKRYRASIPINTEIIVFSDPTEISEVKSAISAHLESFVYQIINSSSAPPTFFVFH